MNNLTLRELMIQLIAQLSSRNEEHANNILEILKKRTGNEFSNAEMWFGWYLKSQANEDDKRVVENNYNLFKRNA